jgi:hypothetical protein
MIAGEIDPRLKILFNHNHLRESKMKGRKMSAKENN